MTPNEAYIRWSELVNDHLERTLKDVELAENFELITRGGDRHGALEWTYYSRDTESDGLDRLISIAVIPAPQRGTGTFEFWFGGRVGDRFMRRLASSLEVSIVEPDWREVCISLADAVDQVHSVTERDLSDVLPAAPF
ncbi:hypothetical protein BX265_3731 [Streptomyces sp. TLI_235]|nr:hypothetical protein [Streptomyces sp. TLI_235]PBC78939.1 hypothetical protein BX265_3731 [Streptomyces sp. TLI_235]